MRIANIQPDPHVLERMVNTLMQAAERAGVSLAGVDASNFNLRLDDLFKDGGETRCECFSDLAWEEAAKYGTFGGDEFTRVCAVYNSAALSELAKRIAH